jgi:hypothetical protein
MLRERAADVWSSRPPREAFEDDRARWLLSSLGFECERPRASSVLVRVRESEERPPIIELKDTRPNVPDVRGWVGSGLGVWPPFVESALDAVRSRPFESACCFVSTLEEDHLEKRGVVGREEVGEEVSETELVRCC